MSELEHSRFIEISEGFPRPESLHNTIVFIRADWSGYSKSSFDNLRVAVSQGLDSSWKVIIVNTDKLSLPDFEESYGPFPSTGGWGEAFWIRDGCVIHRDRGYYNQSLVKLLWMRIQEFSALEGLLVPDFSAHDQFAQSVLKNVGSFPPNQLEIHDLCCREISDLEVAVVTLYHINHARAIVQLRAIAKQLQTLNNPHSKLIVLNADAVSHPDMIRIFGARPHSAQTFWIYLGKIVTEESWLSAARST